jgi:ankyrin repeat protein
LIRDDKPQTLHAVTQQGESQIPNEDGRTALMYAAYLGREQCLEKLRHFSTDMKRDVLAQDNGGRTALHWAAISGDYGCTHAIANSIDYQDALQYFLTKDNSGQSAIDLAYEYENFGAVKAMFSCLYTDEMEKHFIDEHLLPKLEKFTFETLAILADYERNYGVLKSDVRHSISTVGTDRRDWLGRSPLHIAAILGEPSAVTKMLAGGHDPNALDENFSNPLIACLQGSGSTSYREKLIEITKLLLPVTDVLWSDLEGMTALMYAAQNENLAIAELLLTQSDASARDNRGRTALDHLRTRYLSPGESYRKIQDLLDPVTSDYGYQKNRLKDDIQGRIFLKAASAGELDKLRNMLVAEARRQSVGAERNLYSWTLDSLLLVARTDEYELTALMIAARQGHPRCVELLLEYGSQPLRRDRGGRSALMWAAAGKTQSHDECVRVLLPKSHVDAKDNDGSSALFKTIRYPGVGSFEVLFKFARHDFANKSGQTPLMLAAAAGHVQAVKLLLPTSNTKARDSNGKSALDQASGKRPEILQMLIDADSSDELLGSAIASTIDTYGFDEKKFNLLANHGALKSKAVADGTVLLATKNCADARVLELLIPHGDCSVKDLRGKTMLMIAAEKENGYRAVKKLLAFCDPNAVDSGGYTALAHAVYEGNLKCMRALMRKTDPNIRLRDGKTMLMLAAQVNPETIQAILPVSDVNALDDFGADALMYAAKGKPKCVEALLPICDPLRADSSGFTALMNAAYNDSLSCVKALLPHSKVNAKNAKGHTAAQVADSREISVFINKWKSSPDLQSSKKE